MREELAKRWNECSHFRLRLFHSDVCAKAPDHERVRRPEISAIGGIDDQRKPELRSGRKVESLRHNAHDRVADSIDHELLADCGRVATKTLLPEGLTQHHDAIGSRPRVIDTECAPQVRTDIEHVEELCARACGFETHWFPSPRERYRRIPYERSDVHRLAALTKLDELAFVIQSVETDETIRLRIRQWFQQHAVDDRKDARARGDAEHECQHDRRPERGLTPKLTDGVGCVATNLLDPHRPARIATLLL